MKAIAIPAATAALALFAVAAADAQTQQGHGADHRPCTPGQIGWSAGPPSLRRGAEMALLQGDPSREGPFVMRLRLPDGFAIAPHRHGGAEILTVISGTFALGVGEDATKGEPTRMPAGCFTAMPAGMPHFARVEGETVVQPNSIGPWTITSVNPNDDPRRR